VKVFFARRYELRLQIIVVEEFVHIRWTRASGIPVPRDTCVATDAKRFVKQVKLFCEPDKFGVGTAALYPAKE